MNILQSLILAVIEGISEFLPISSTGHLILAAKLLSVAQSEFVKSFEISIQLGAILAVVALYWKKLVENGKWWDKIIAAFVPSAVVGLLFYKIIKSLLIGNLMVTIWALFIGGVIMIILEKTLGKKAKFKQIEQLDLRKAVIVGLFQTVSIIPGVSRAAATIFGGMIVGLSREAAVEFSFLLAVPTMAAATGLDLLKAGWQFSSQEIGVLGIGFVTAFAVAYVAIKFLLIYVRKNNFVGFGIYRIILAICYWKIVLG